MTVGSLFSGIGGFDLGLERAGMQIAWQVEIEPFCLEILEVHFPNAKRHREIRQCGRANLAPVDLICAGVPCQDVSVAGRRAGLAGERTGLFFEFARILRELRPHWFVFENVPGLLSSNGGRDFAEVLRVLMVECGYGLSWRVLDSKFFGVAQRRRRVFIVGYFGGSCPGEVLFEPKAGRRNIAARGEARQETAGALTASTGGACGAGGGREAIAFALRASDGHHGYSGGRGDGCDNIIAAPLIAGSHPNSPSPGEAKQSGTNLVAAALNSCAGGFRSEPGAHIVIQDVRGRREKRQHGIGIRVGGPCFTLGAVERHGVAVDIYNGAEPPMPTTIRSGAGAVGIPHVYSSPADPDGVRDFAGLPPGLDSPRYRALGNAVTVQVAEWIGARIIRAAEGGKLNA